jgi:hypothetical protein
MGFQLPDGDVCKSTDVWGSYVVTGISLVLACVVHRQRSDDVRYASVFSWFFFVLILNHLYESYFPEQIGDNKKVKDAFWFAPLTLAAFPLILGATKAVLLELLFYFGLSFVVWDAIFGSTNIAAAAAVGLGLFGITYIIPQLRNLAMKVWLTVVLTVTYLVMVVALTSDDDQECGAARNLFLLCSANCSVITRDYHFDILPLTYSIGSYVLVFAIFFFGHRACCRVKDQAPAAKPKKKQKEKKQKPRRRGDGYEEMKSPSRKQPDEVEMQEEGSEDEDVEDLS